MARVMRMAADEPCFVAMDVADAFVESSQATPEDRERIEWVAMCVGSYLAEVDRPGQWATIHMPELGPWLAELERRELEDFCFTLAWLISYLGCYDELSPRNALRILSELSQWCDDRGLRVDVRAAAGPLPTIN